MTNPLFDPNASTTPAIDPSKDYAPELIGDGKKYKDISAAARAIMEKDAFIERLQSETSQMRSALKGEQKIDEFLRTLQATQSAPANTQNPVTTPGNSVTNQPTTTTPPALSMAEVETFLAAKEKEKTEATNLAQAVTQVKAAFGANYQDVMNQKAAELGATPDFLLGLAKTQPQAFIKLVGAEKSSVQAPNAPQSSVNTAGFGSKAPVGGKTKSHYDKLRKEVGDARFFAPAIQNELHREMMRLGEAFFDN